MDGKANCICLGWCCTMIDIHIQYKIRWKWLAMDDWNGLNSLCEPQNTPGAVQKCLCIHLIWLCNWEMRPGPDWKLHFLAGVKFPACVACWISGAKLYFDGTVLFSGGTKLFLDGAKSLCAGAILFHVGAFKHPVGTKWFPAGAKWCPTGAK